MSAEALLAGLESFRRRAGLVAGLSAALASASVVAAAAELLRWSGFATGPAGRMTGIAAAAIAGLAALGVTWMRRPPLGEVARAVDTRLRLQAVVITAFQCREEGDAFAVRTVTRATQALAGARPRDVYPWQVHRAALWLTAASGGVLLWLMAGSAPLPGVRQLPGEAVGTEAVSLPRQPAATTAPGVAPPGGAPSESSAVASSPSQASPQAQAGAAANPSGNTRSDRGGPDAGSRPSLAVRPPEPAPSASADSGTAAARPSSGMARTGESLTSGGAPGPSGSAVAAPGGGQRGGPLGSTARNQPARGASGTADATTARSQSGAQEQALALERVPMSRRTYVQRYLQSLGLGRSEPSSSAEPR